MTKLADAFPSKFLKAADLNDGPIIATIKLAELEQIKGFDGREKSKVVLYFTKKLKPLPLNRTNFEAVMDICGSDDSDDFIGVKVEAYATKTSMNGKVMDCVRLRAPDTAEKTKPKKAAPKDDDEKPPFNDEANL
jgi:hypothetical protein